MKQGIDCCKPVEWKVGIIDIQLIDKKCSWQEDWEENKFKKFKKKS